MTQDHPTDANGGGPAGGAATDEALVAAVAAAGDRAAFAELFRRHAGRVKAFLMRSGTPEPVAEEAAQEVMITLWRRAHLFDPAKASATTWIFAIARNKRIDLARRDARAAVAADDPLMAPEAADGAERSFAGAERDARVRAAVLALSPEQREVVRLAFFAELSHGAVAAELGLPLGTVKSRLRLAFQRLRSDLGEAFSLELTDD